jgi:hypothetical protein
VSDEGLQATDCLNADLVEGRKAQINWINGNNIQLQGGQGHNPLLIFDVCSYQALAAAAIHPHAYLFTKKGVDWRQDSMWNQVEFWQLTKNKNIKRIYRVDPRPWDVAGACADVQSLQRGDPVGSR